MRKARKASKVSQANKETQVVILRLVPEAQKFTLVAEGPRDNHVAEESSGDRDPMQLWFDTIFEELLKDGVRFVVAGGVAVAAHGVPRFTADIDLIVELETENVLKLARCMKQLGFKPKVPVPAEAFADPANREQWINEKNMRVFSFQHPDRPYELVDIFVKEPIPFALLWKNKELIPFGAIQLPVISLDHLIQLKREAGRLQDLSDVEALERLKEELADEGSS